MKFGVREICNVVFRATTTQTIGNKTFKKGQPVFYLDTAKTSSVEGAATTVYAQGGRGNTRLIAWEGERTLTFTVEDALLSPISFAMLSGAGVVKGLGEKEEVHFHQTSTVLADAETGIIDLTNALEPDESVDVTAPLFIMKTDESGDLTGDIVEGDFILVRSSDQTINGKKLIYGQASDLAAFSAVSGNNGRKAWPFPYTINDDHTATVEQVQNWNTNKDTTSPTLAEPVPVEVVKTASNGYCYIPSGVWTVTNEYDGEDITVEIPTALAKPVFSYAELATYYTNNTSATNPLGTTDTEKNYIVVGENGKGFTPSNLAAAANVRGSNVKIKEYTNGTETGDAITIVITSELKQKVISKYFGIDTGNNTTASSQDKAARAALETSYENAWKATKAKVAFDATAGQPLMVDYYVIKKSASVTELQIDAENFAGYYYVEADTLFRRQIDGKDLPANLTFPNVKIQSNFTFSMASTGDPSTFTFTMDAFPGYTYFDKTKKVLCAIQIVDDKKNNAKGRKTIFPHKTGVTLEASMNDSSPDIYDEYSHDTAGSTEIGP